MEAFLVILTLAAVALVAANPRRFRSSGSRSAANTFIAVWGSVLLGAILGPTVTGIIPAEPITNATPMAILGLGMIGVMVGAQARRRLLVAVPVRIWIVVTADALVTAILVGSVAYAALRIWFGSATPLLAPAAVVVAASMGWSMETRSAQLGTGPEINRLAIAIRASGGLLAIVAILTAGLASIVANSDTPASSLIDSAIIIIVAVTAALLLKFAMSLSTGRRGDQLTVFLGAVGLGAGTAAEIGISPLMAALLTGVAIANLPGMGLRSFEAFILKIEHVVAAVFGLLAGVFIDIEIGLVGLAFALALTAARLLLKPLTLRFASRFIRRVEALPRSSPLDLSPMRLSPVAIALAVSLVLLDPTSAPRRILTVVLVTGMLSELCFIAIALRASRRQAAAETAANTEAVSQA